MCICCLHYRRLIIHHQIWNSVWNCKIQWNFLKCKVHGRHKTDGELPQEVSIQAKSPVGRFGDRPGARDGCCGTTSLWSKMVIFCRKCMVMSISTFMQRVTHFSKTYCVQNCSKQSKERLPNMCTAAAQLSHSILLSGGPLFFTPSHLIWLRADTHWTLVNCH
jgi:hypothetical protein